MIDLKATFTSRDVDQLFSQIDRAQRELGKSNTEAVAWAGRLVASSLSASTRQAPKLRKIVKNPNPKAKTDGRMAKFGVMRYKPNGQQYFVPIYSGGEFGAKMRFTGRRTTVLYSRDSLGNVVKTEVDTKSVSAPDLMGSKKRVIGRRGLAKAAWRAAGARIMVDGARSDMGVRNIASVKWRGKKSNDTTLNMTNNLRYADSAWNKQGSSAQTVETAMMRAAINMEKRISRAIDKKLGRAT